MSIVLEYNPENKILYLSIMDELSSSELADALKKITHSDDYPPDVGILLDVSSINMPINNIKLYLKSAGVQNIILKKEKAKIAIIASDFPSNLHSKYDMLSDTASLNIMIFNNFIEGEEWLGWREN